MLQNISDLSNFLNNLSYTDFKHIIDKYSTKKTRWY